MKSFSRIVIGMVALIFGFTTESLAQTDTYIFNGNSTIHQQVVSGTLPTGGAHLTSTAVFTLVASDGTPSTGTTFRTNYDCIQWFTPDDSEFGLRGACSAQDAGANAGKYWVDFWCKLYASKAISDCWSNLTGLTGTYLNKIGSGTWHGTSGGTTVTFYGAANWSPKAASP